MLHMKILFNVFSVKMLKSKLHGFVFYTYTKLKSNLCKPEYFVGNLGDDSCANVQKVIIQFYSPGNLFNHPIHKH